MPMQVILAQPRGFCAGVERAIDIVERALRKYGPPIYVRHEIVHNKHVVEQLRAKGVVFVEDLDDVPPGVVTIFSAHGVARSVEDMAADKDLPVIDATCPLVSKVHIEGRKYAAQGREVILIGHAGHPEVEGTVGQIPGTVHVISTADDARSLQVADPDKLAYVTQTTLSLDDTRGVVDALKERFPAIAGLDTKDICYATQNRQRAVRVLAEQCDLLLVVGAANSSNSNRLREIGELMGVPSYLINDARELDPAWLADKQKVGVTAGASAPEVLVEGLIDALRVHGADEVTVLEGVEETVRFRLPRELQDGAEAEAETNAAE
ncbi:4-hydroxy-3-methylbut-2-enyl diphosphate reductase [Caenispirillum salinarum AK4]|uniref:4-hydroxy-3-methylbut-2-enyl diphosphate reductase n=2 Tax=Caenispirillum TaxID=414051 RepID=K9HJ28_9PROT|nr:4-hydroxy-3-methylbut-2-enyl diphosphate reductase [Caenispirillum salinarum AK4]